jgi:hypothetical protein
LEVKPVTLDLLGGGIAAEKFSAELSRVLDNIADVNTAEDAVREIKMVFKFKPTKSRAEATVLVEASSKLAPHEGTATHIYLGRKSGRNIAVANDERQVDLAFADPKTAPMEAINGGKTE